ncbi:hypothetical protein F4W70_18265 [Pseudomonas cannabina]|nr:hypothetical protein F4W70_18265 [Pseudomonas cannabina]
MSGGYPPFEGREEHGFGNSASDLQYAVRRRYVTQSVTKGIPTLEHRNDNLNYRATLCVGMPFWTLQFTRLYRPLREQARSHRSCVCFNYRATLCVGMPFWTLQFTGLYRPLREQARSHRSCVCFNYRATLCVGMPFWTLRVRSWVCVRRRCVTRSVTKGITTGA